MGLLKFVRDAYLFREIPIGEIHILELCFGTAIDAPPHDPHMSGVTKTPVLPWYFVFLLRSMNELMARLAERYEIVRAIPSCFA